MCQAPSWITRPVATGPLPTSRFEFVLSPSSRFGPTTLVGISAPKIDLIRALRVISPGLECLPFSSLGDWFLPPSDLG